PQLTTAQKAQPISVPMAAPGSMILNRPQSHSLRYIQMATASMQSSTGSIMPAASRGAMMRVSNGTPTTPNPPRRPALDRPTMSTADTAMKMESGSNIEIPKGSAPAHALP